ncbi:hypothetical protein [Microbacterium allomyrinae]|nr:hypothetical protein [Microbacterium allomyrinae]
MRATTIGRMIAALTGAVGAAALLPSCTAAPQEVPVPSSAAAWGEAIVPYAEEIAFIVEQPDDASGSVDRAATTTADPGASVRFTASVTTSEPLEDTHLVLSDSSDIGRVSEVRLVESGVEHPVDAQERAALDSDGGLPVGDLAVGSSLEFTFEVTLAEDVVCGSPTYRVWFVLRADSGARNYGAGSVQALTPECSAATPVPAP